MMSWTSHCSDPKRIKLDSNDIIEPGTSSILNNSNLDDLVNSPSDTGENTSIISAFDHDSSSILSGSIYESSGDVLLSDLNTTKSILKSPEFGGNNTKRTSKHRIKFHGVEIYYFNRQQSFCSVPSLGGSALGMEMQHFLTEKLRFDKDAELYVCKRKCEPNSFEKINKGTKEEYSILQPIVAKHRRALLKNSGTTKIETVDREVCDLIRSSRERCGCQCIGGRCVPDTCSCAQNGIQCQVDRGNFPCCCGPTPCVNPLGRVEFNPIRVRTHFIHTIMRLQMQDQYQSDEPRHRTTHTETTETESRISKEFDINLCNSTNQGSCRDCQNDKYLHVLMNEWTHQLQKLQNTSKPYSSNVSIPHNSWTYLPEAFCATTYCDKESAMFPILPYSQYTVANLPALNFGVYYPNHATTALQYQLNTSSYSNHLVDENFAAKSNIVNFALRDDAIKPVSYIKQQSQDIPTSNTNSDAEPVKADSQLVSSTYPPQLKPEKPSIYARYPSDPKESTFLCKYNTNLSAVHHDQKEFGYTAAAYTHAASCAPDKCADHIADEELSHSQITDNDKNNQNKIITQASNGQLYTVLQPVSESGIVTSFYRNSQACFDSCKICKYKSPDNRQRLDHFCISDFAVATAIYSNSANQIPIECTEKSEVCA